jgi:hypothetical protein
VTYKLEGTPTDDQKERLEDWLQEMKLICRKYSLALTSEDEEVVVLDLASGNVVGIGIVPLTSGDPPYITAFDCAGCPATRSPTSPPSRSVSYAKAKIGTGTAGPGPRSPPRPATPPPTCPSTSGAGPRRSNDRW